MITALPVMAIARESLSRPSGEELAGMATDMLTDAPTREKR